MFETLQSGIMEVRRMKAYVLHGINDIRLEETEKPRAGEDEVLVKVRAAGICGSDIPRIYTTGTYSYPLIPGHEFSGVVEDAGGESGRKWLGKRVGIYPLIPCRECVPCQKKQYEMCRHYNYLGSRCNGGFAEYVAVPVWNLIGLPEETTFEEAAMMEPMAVAVHAIRQMELNGQETVAVIGLGTIGILLTMFLKEMGVKRILTVGNKDSQKEMVAKQGIPEEDYYDSRQNAVDDWLREASGGNRIDVIFECVGKQETIAQAIQNVMPGGKVQLVGNPASDVLLERNLYWKILRNQLTVKGSWNSSFTHDESDDWHYVLKRLAQKKVRPMEYITKSFPFERLEEGLHIMRDKSQEYVKIEAFL